MRRLNAALSLLGEHAQAAIDSLQLLRVDAIAHDPALAAALGPVIDSARTGGNSAAAIARARRVAAGAPAVERNGVNWEGAP